MSELKKQGGSSLRWPLIVVGLLVTHVVAMMYAVTFINSRTRTLGVVDNYYERAVDWDKQRALARESAALGWQVKIEPSNVVTGGGQRTVKVVLTDSSGAPVTGATVEIVGIHGAHADAPAKASAPAGDSGEFARELRMPWEGFYDFTVTAKVGDKTFVSNVTQWVATTEVRAGSL